MSEVNQAQAAAVAKAALDEQAKARAEAAKQRAADLKAYQERVKTMSHRQLRGDLRRMTKDGPGLNSIIATVSLIVLENTETKENPFAKLGAYIRCRPLNLRKHEAPASFRW